MTREPNANPGVLTHIAAYAQLARVSNLGTCLSNVLVGCALATVDTPLRWRSVVVATVAVCLLYVAALAMNDLVDVDIDRQTRPDRPIPSGRIRLWQAYLFMLCALAMGLGVLAATNTTALGLGVALVIAAIAYNVTHHRDGRSVLLMGLCRALVYLVATAVAGASAMLQSLPIALVLAGTLAAYTAAITFVARVENDAEVGRRRWVLVVMVAVVLAAATPLRPQELQWPLAMALAIVIWLGHGIRQLFDRPPRTRQTVMIWLSGMCLVDAYFLTMLDRPGLALVAVPCFVSTALAHRLIPGT